MSTAGRIYCYDYPRPMVTVDVAVFANDGTGPHILLIRRKKPPFEGLWALPGGFVDIEEDLETAARRELEEETGLRVGRLRQFRTYGDPHRDPRGRVITIVYSAHHPMVPPQSGDDAADARWFPLDRLPDLAFDHAQIIADLIAARRHLPDAAPQTTP